MERKLERNTENRMLGGVAGGLADYLLIELTLVRLIFIVAALLGSLGFWIYIILWIVLPPKTKPFRPIPAVDYVMKEESDFSNRFSESASVNKNTSVKSSGSKVWGLLLIAVGTYFMLGELDILPHWLSLVKLWPLVIILLGLMILFKPSRNPVKNN